MKKIIFILIIFLFPSLVLAQKQVTKKFNASKIVTGVMMVDPVKSIELNSKENKAIPIKLENGNKGSYQNVIQSFQGVNNTKVLSLTNADINLTLYSGDGADNSYTPATVSSGGTFTSKLSVVNWGTVASGDFKIYITLSTDDYWDSNLDYKAGELSATSISGGYYRNMTINCTVPYSVSSGQYYVMMIIDPTGLAAETNETDNIWYYHDKMTVQNDISAPEISHIPPATATYNTALNLSATATDLESGVKTFYAQYRKSGDLWEDNLKVPFTNGVATIPANYITERGVDYRIYAEDQNYNYDYWYNEKDNWLSYYSVPVAVPAANINAYNTTGGSEYTAYKLFSVPYDFGQLKASELLGSVGTYMKDWRLRVLVSGTSFADANEGLLELGSASFLITKNNAQIKATKAGTTSRASYYDNIGITVKTGWSLVGNPFPFRIATNNVMKLLNPSDVYNSPNAEVWDYQGTKGWQKADYLYAWEGVAVYNPGVETKLQFWVGYSSLAQKVSQIKNDSRNWDIQLVVKNEKTIDEVNHFGMQESERAAKGELNSHEPPVIGQAVSGYFNGLDNNGVQNKFAEDYRSFNENGATWDLTVTAPENEKVTLTFNNLNSVPSHFEKYLVDVDRNISYDLSTQNNISIFSGEGKRNFKIVVGKSGYVNENSKGISFVPENISLSQNYPNPFNPATNIMFNLPKDSHVKLLIYDTYGRLVNTLLDQQKSAGYYEVPFKAENLASGVYYYKLVVQGGTNFVDMKKMVLIK